MKKQLSKRRKVGEESTLVQPRTPRVRTVKRIENPTAALKRSYSAFSNEDPATRQLPWVQTRPQMHQRKCACARALSHAWLCFMFALANTKKPLFLCSHTPIHICIHMNPPSHTPPHAHTPQPTVSHLVLQVGVGAGGEQRCHHLHVAVVGGLVEGGPPVLQAAGRP